MNVLLTLEAIYDVADIADYIEAYFGDERSLLFQIEIEQRFHSLDSYKRTSTGIRYQNNPIYRDVFSPSLIFFVIVDDTIHVLRVLREERDWIKVLRDKQHYHYL